MSAKASEKSREKRAAKPAKNAREKLSKAAEFVGSADELEELRAAARRLHEAEDLEAVARAAEQRYLESREETKALKKEFEAAAEKVRKVIREKSSGLLPFSQPASEPLSSDSGASERLAGPEIASGGDDAAEREQRAFNAASLSDIGIVGKQAEKLEADGITTGGDLQKWIAGHPRRKIAGIGDGAIEKITELMAQWYERRPRAIPVVPVPLDPKKEQKQLRALLEARLEASGIDNTKHNRMKLIAHVAEIDVDKIERFAATATGETLAKWRAALQALDEIKPVFAEEPEPQPAASEAA